MKLLISLIITFFLILSISKAQNVNINIKELTTIEASSIKYNSTITDGKPLNLKIELYDPGSTGYKARLRLDIFDKDNLIFTGWSDEKEFFPGNRKIYDLYWYALDVKGKFKASIRVYYANEINQIKQINLEVKPSKKSPENIFEILDFRTYNDEVSFLVRTNKTTDNVIFMPSNYPNGWIFEQYKIDKLESGNIKLIKLKYEPTLWRQNDVTIDIFTEDGNYYTSKSFTMNKETSFWQHIYGIINNIRILFRL